MIMGNSSLVTYKHICKHYDKGREGKKISKIFVHHMAGNLTVKQCGNVFDNRAASAHYGVNGNAVGLYVNESDTAWHCGNWGYNTKSIGIELANDGGANWHVSDTTIATAIKLIADICQRNGIKKLNYTGDMNGNLCMHKWVCSTSCPGPYLATKFKYIAAQVNKILGNGETIDPSLPSPFGKLEVDGIGGPDTVGSTQRFLGTTVDFEISGQKKANRKYYEAFRDDVIEFADGGSEMVRHIQWLVGVYESGILDAATVKAVQKLLGVEKDGYWGPITMKAWQRYLNTHEKAEYPATHAAKPAAKTTTTTKKAATSTAEKTSSTAKTTALQDKIMDACKKVASRAKKASYGWRSNPSWDSIDNEGTCVSFVAVVLQLLGYKKKGNYVWHNGKGYGTGKVTGATDSMSVTYFSNPKLSSCKDKIKKGDILVFDDNKSGKSGDGGHICIATGDWKGNDCMVWDIGKKMICERTGKPRAYDGSHKLRAIVRLK